MTSQIFIGYSKKDREFAHHSISNIKLNPGQFL